MFSPNMRQIKKTRKSSHTFIVRNSYKYCTRDSHSLISLVFSPIRPFGRAEHANRISGLDWATYGTDFGPVT